MAKSFLVLLQLLKDIHRLLSEIKEMYAQREKISNALLTKPEVMCLLKISDTTYRRYVKSGRLTPIKLHGIDMYREEDLRRELEESRRKGRR